MAYTQTIIWFNKNIMCIHWNNASKERNTVVLSQIIILWCKSFLFNFENFTLVLLLKSKNETDELISSNTLEEKMMQFLAQNIFEKSSKQCGRQGSPHVHLLQVLTAKCTVACCQVGKGRYQFWTFRSRNFGRCLRYRNNFHSVSCIPNIKYCSRHRPPLDVSQR